MIILHSSIVLGESNELPYEHMSHYERESSHNSILRMNLRKLDHIFGSDPVGNQELLDKVSEKDWDSYFTEHNNTLEIYNDD